MKKRIIEDYSPNFMYVENFPFVGKLLVAECPSEYILSYPRVTSKKQMKKE